MNNWTVIINFSIGIIGLILSILGLLLNVMLSPRGKFASRRYSNVIFAILIAYSATVILSYLSELDANAEGMRWGIFLSSLFSSMLTPVLTAFILTLSNGSRKRSGLFWTVAALWCVYFGMLLSTLFLPVFYTIDNMGVYHRGPLYPLLLVPPALIMALNLWGLWRRRV